MLLFSGCYRVVLLTFLGASIHLFHLLVYDGKDWIGLKLHWTRTNTRLHGSLGPRPLVIARSFLASNITLVLCLNQTTCLSLFRRIRLVLIEKNCGFLLRRVCVVQVHGATTDHVCISELFLANWTMLGGLVPCILRGTTTSCCMLIFSCLCLFIHFGLVICDGFLQISFISI